MKIRNDSMAVSRPFSNVHEHGLEHERYKLGEVITPIGIVTTYSQERGQCEAMTILYFVFNRRLHMRTIYRTHTDRALATIAHRFAKEVST